MPELTRRELLIALNAAPEVSRGAVYRLAQDCGLHGWVRNDSGGLYIELDAILAVVEVKLLVKYANPRPVH